MDNRLLLQARLEEILGSPNVYFQPNESTKIKYDCIVYSCSDIENRHANNSVYKQDIAYEIVVIFRNPDSEIPLKVSALPKCRFSRAYTADNLNHYVFTLYW